MLLCNTFPQNAGNLGSKSIYKTNGSLKWPQEPLFYNNFPWILSPPMRGRGLKLNIGRGVHGIIRSPPMRGRGLKLQILYLLQIGLFLRFIL